MCVEELTLKPGTMRKSGDLPTPEADGVLIDERHRLRCVHHVPA
jgi:hypothetical protein